MLGALLRPHLGQLDAAAPVAGSQAAPAFLEMAEYVMEPEGKRQAASQVLMRPLLTAGELLTLRECGHE